MPPRGEDMTPDNSEGYSRRHLLHITATSGIAGSITIAGTSTNVGATTADSTPYGDPDYPSEDWFAREQANWAKTREEPIRQANDPAFQERWQEQSLINYLAFRQQELAETEWDRTGLCRRWTNQCTGDPYRFPADDLLWSGHPFYTQSGNVERVVFYDRADTPARLNGRVWWPADAQPGADLPGVVIMNGGVATETMYWWFAHSLVDHGYIALTFDPVGQGRSEDSELTHTDHHIDALDFFTSTHTDPYPHNGGNERADHDTVPVTDENPVADLLDTDRIGTVGHSRGASSTSVVQGLTPWPGVGDNPVTAAVAWDNPNPAGSEYDGYTVEPRVPLMGQSADYKGEGLIENIPELPDSWVPQPKHDPPDPTARNAAYQTWVDANVPTFQVNFRGTTHFEWSQVPSFPSSRWADWGNEAANHYTIAWLDYWLKESGEPGYDNAPDRLHETDPWHDRLSFYYQSAYNYPTARHPTNWPPRNAGTWNTCDNILADDC